MKWKREQLLSMIQKECGHKSIREFLVKEYVKTHRGKKHVGALIGVGSYTITRLLQERNLPSKKPGGPNFASLQPDSFTQYVLDRIQVVSGIPVHQYRERRKTIPLTIQAMSRMIDVPPQKVRNALRSRRMKVRRNDGTILDFDRCK